MNAYIYQAALYCESCGEDTRLRLSAEGLAPEDPRDEESYDSDDYPKGPYPQGGGEADGPQVCDGCGAFLENPLTSDGYLYMIETLAGVAFNDEDDCPPESEMIGKWREFYFQPYRVGQEVYSALRRLRDFAAEAERPEGSALRKLGEEGYTDPGVLLAAIREFVAAESLSSFIHGGGEDRLAELADDLRGLL